MSNFPDIITNGKYILGSLPIFAFDKTRNITDFIVSKTMVVLIGIFSYSIIISIPFMFDTIFGNYMSKDSILLCSNFLTTQIQDNLENIEDNPEDIELKFELDEIQSDNLINNNSLIIFEKNNNLLFNTLLSIIFIFTIIVYLLITINFLNISSNFTYFIIGLIIFVLIILFLYSFISIIKLLFIKNNLEINKLNQNETKYIKGYVISRFILIIILIYFLITMITNISEVNKFIK